MKIGKYEFPDKCPDDCKLMHSFIYQGQGCMCHRCPVFNCTTCPGDEFRMMRPDEYRLDWAAEWYEFFRSGKYPELKLKME